MKKDIFNKRIPTVLAIVLLLGGLIISSILINQGVYIVSQASPQEEPQNVRIVNITKDSFTVSFTTTVPTVAGVSIENTNPPRLIYDKRDSSGKKEFYSHFITVSDVSPQTTYEFNILSGGDVYLNQGEKYKATTAPASSNTAPNTFPLAGTVILPDGSDGSDVLVYLSIPNTSPIGAITDGRGSYRIPANNIRNQATFNTLTISPNTPIKISAYQAGNTSNTSYTYKPGALIPPITLTNNYSFIASEEEETTQPEDSLLALPTSIQKATQVAITIPQRNQSFTDLRPQFRGTSAPNTSVRLVVTTQDDIQAQVRSDANGNWTFRPSVQLSPGSHTLSATGTNAQGAQRNVTTAFTVFASGSQIAESATPSATLTPTRVSTPTTTPTISVALSTTPIPNASPTPLVTVVASPTIIATTPTTIISTPTTQPTVVIPPKKPIPPTGGNLTTILLTSLAVVFIVTGSLFLFIL